MATDNLNKIVEEVNQQLADKIVETLEEQSEKVSNEISEETINYISEKDFHDEDKYDERLNDY